LPHVIRLRAPWEIEPLPEPPGLLRCTRHFNRPTGLESGERVWLVLPSLASPGTIVLNGDPLEPTPGLPADGGSVRCEITSRLTARNKVEIQLAANTDTALALLEQVRLEIE
jgi:hypothetical protein